MNDNQDFAEGIFVIFIVLLAITFSIFLLICRWRICKKAGKEGWESLIPIYNIIILLEIVKKPTWWIFLLLIPIYNIYIILIINIRLAKFFGKGDLFGVLLTFFNFIFEPILAFGDANYDSEALSDDRSSNAWS